MGHHHREEAVNSQQTIETGNNSEHPFFKGNDLACLSIVLPLLSESGKQLITFFMNYGNNKPASSMNDPMTLLQQLAPKLENSPLKEILPSLLALLVNKDSKSSINPGILSSLLTNADNKKEDQISDLE